MRAPRLHSEDSAPEAQIKPPARLDEGRRGRLLVVSHPAVVDVNQEVYRELAARGWDVKIVVPASWRHSYSPDPVRPQALDGLQDSLLPLAVVLRGRPQRHLYLARVGALVRALAPDVAFLEEEPFALAATQWGRALRRARVPFGVQSYENIDRALPRPVLALRARVLRDAAFVAARSQTAATLVREWGARGEIGLAPPAVPSWSEIPPAPARSTFTIGFAGRLVESKGLLDLVAAVRELDAPVALVMIGDGELRGALEGAEIPGSRVRVLTGLTHERMPEGYVQCDVIALPSRTTPTWKEQFGRVIVEALWCGVPVVGSDSGEIPWLIGLTEGGLTFPEGDVAALAAALARLRADPALRERLGRRGRERVREQFTVAAATDALERLLTGALGDQAASRAATRA